MRGILHMLLELSFDISKDSTYPYEKKSNTKYVFKSGKYDYEVNFTNFYKNSGVFVRSYKPVKETYRGMTKEGKALKVIATVTAITLDFMNTNKYWNTIIINPVSDKRSRILKLFFDQSYFDNYNIEEVEPNEFRITKKIKY
jgi:hypothetical protein